MSEQVEGACLCGAVRYELTMPSRFCAHCHCQNCRRAQGAAFVTYAGFKREQVEITGAQDLQRYETDTGATRSVCRHCGSTLFYEGPRWPGEVHVVLVSRVRSPLPISLALNDAGCVGPPRNTPGMSSSVRLASVADASPKLARDF